MPNIKSQKKRMKKSREQRASNRSVKSSLKNTIKKFETACESGDLEQVQSSYIESQKALDKAASKGVIHKNKAANKKSSLARAINAMKQ